MSFAHYVFDAYGTLFDVHSAAARHRDAIGPDWERLSSLWRQKQLEYTWVHAGMGRHATFAALTEQSLDFAIASMGGVAPGTRARLLEAYRSLEAYPEVKGALAQLKTRGARLAILSNGDPDMLEAAIHSAGLDGAFDAVLSVASAGVFKPAMRVYELATRQSGSSRPPSRSSPRTAGTSPAGRRSAFAPSGSTARVRRTNIRTCQLTSSSRI